MLKLRKTGAITQNHGLATWLVREGNDDLSVFIRGIALRAE